MGNDAKLYRRFLDGDDNGLAELIDIYNEGLSLYINSIVNNICEAEELMQETFVKIAIKKPGFNGKYKFKTWLYTIARNCTYDYLRHRSRYADFTIDECFYLSDEIDIERKYLIDEQKIELHKAMQKIKPDYSQVLYLMYFESFKTDDIARIMHKSKSQIKDLIYRAKKSLKSELERAGFIYTDLSK
ncbi:RNA polymerase sigma factor [Ruminococcus flavefaciens]|uniref:RNA polymerase sigma factor n=1 Tax=Ruminococcus flavefaciens TaxID=1265 RepID=UPI0026ED9DF5|nr:RNA polymerase sigma factor [Ruminococcus flavefaciens]